MHCYLFCGSNYSSFGQGQLFFAWLHVPLTCLQCVCSRCRWWWSFVGKLWFIVVRSVFPSFEPVLVLLAPQHAVCLTVVLPATALEKASLPGNSGPFACLETAILEWLYFLWLGQQVQICRQTDPRGLSVCAHAGMSHLYLC